MCGEKELVRERSDSICKRERKGKQNCVIETKQINFGIWLHFYFRDKSYNTTCSGRKREPRFRGIPHKWNLEWNMLRTRIYSSINGKCNCSVSTIGLQVSEMKA